MIKKAFIGMQFLVVIAIIAMNGWVFYKTGELNDTLTGALIGLATGIPLSLLDQVEAKSEE